MYITQIIQVAAFIVLTVYPVVPVDEADFSDNDPIADGLRRGVELMFSDEPESTPTTAPEVVLENVLQNIVTLLSVIAGIVAVFMIIFAGFKYVTSRGDASVVSSAKNTIVYVIVGLLFVAFAQLIVQFVISQIQT